jgi:RNA polymerase sigma factor (sigma-70 family)
MGIYHQADVTPLLAQRPKADRAFERLYRRHVHDVYRYSLAVLHNQADAEDVTQITFFSAYKAFCRGERPDKPHNWLIKIAHNACRQRFRESSRRPQEVQFEETVPAPAADEDVPTADEIRRALGFLSFNQRAALVMRELEGRSYAEIAQVLELTIPAVETLLFRARRALREQLEGDLTCEQAELTLSQLQEKRLSNAERGALRAHLRECKDCAALERRQRAQRAAFRSLGTIPLPASLTSFGSSLVGGGVAATGTGLGAKAAAVLAAGLVSAGVGHETFQAVASDDRPSRATLPALQTGKQFSPVSSLTGGQATANPIVERTAGAKAGRARPADTAGGGPGGFARPGSHRGLVDGDGSDSSEPQPRPAAAPAARPVTTTVTETLPLPIQPPPPPQLPVKLPPPPPLPPLPPPPPLPPLPPLPPVPPVPPLPPPPPLP